jgi:hypothetical protein
MIVPILKNILFPRRLRAVRNAPDLQFCRYSAGTGGVSLKAAQKPKF